jgi:hypothetical protein
MEKTFTPIPIDGITSGATLANICNHKEFDLVSSRPSQDIQ